MPGDTATGEAPRKKEDRDSGDIETRRQTERKNYQARIPRVDTASNPIIGFRDVGIYIQEFRRNDRISHPYNQRVEIPAETIFGRETVDIQSIGLRGVNNRQSKIHPRLLEG